MNSPLFISNCVGHIHDVLRLSTLYCGRSLNVEHSIDFLIIVCSLNWLGNRRSSRLLLDFVQQCLETVVIVRDLRVASLALIVVFIKEAEHLVEVHQIVFVGDVFPFHEPT